MCTECSTEVIVVDLTEETVRQVAVTWPPPEGQHRRQS